MCAVAHRLLRRNAEPALAWEGRASDVMRCTEKLAVVAYEPNTDISSVLAAALGCLRHRGIRLAGLLQGFGEILPNGKRAMWVDDLQTGQRLRLDSPRGPGATACVLDPDALARAACILQRAIGTQAELICISRFGREEASGRGMRAEIADAILSGTAVLIPVRGALLGDLEAFLGHPASLVAAREAAIVTWAELAAGVHPALA